ncbi:uncharacterized protein LY79DRAFT_156219 [Colletotrichum navitas]|uniref:Uncharacterized protein n=1 Tax=Colletotrichum navitas TaxID=681940 RepID=A0AAD8V4Y2_9PEZI|nr:uncharacterized protein LY79DRAFT_156219 [Colletotrichum navitas]KAK1594422.1 hypothetical protein LY79DRAFT_156219 [Colletotrichum navitas]
MSTRRRRKQMRDADIVCGDPRHQHYQHPWPFLLCGVPTGSAFVHDTRQNSSKDWRPFASLPPHHPLLQALTPHRPVTHGTRNVLHSVPSHRRDNVLDGDGFRIHGRECRCKPRKGVTSCSLR